MAKMAMPQARGTGILPVKKLMAKMAMPQHIRPFPF